MHLYAYSPCIYRGKRESEREKERFLSLFITCKQVAPSLLGNSIESSANGKNVLEIKICNGPHQQAGGMGKGNTFSGQCIRESQML